MTNPAIAKADKWLRSPRYAGTAESVVLSLKAELQNALGQDAAPTATPRAKLKVVSP